LGVRHFLIPDPGKGAIHQIGPYLLAPARHSSSSGCASTTAGATIVPRAFACGRGCGSADGIALGLHTPCPAVARLPATRPPAASTAPTSPRYPRPNLGSTATVVDNVV